ncbi:MAG: Uma2 family endonuclease [Leptolyngbyaceae cyanobacterium]
MIAIHQKVITLEAFLASPNIEESPAWEYIDGHTHHKPMPKTRHSLLQKRLLNIIDRHTDDYTALPELRCTFGGRSIVPDVAVVAWDRIPLGSNGEPEDDFTQSPDWSIEILSPQQSATRVIDNILHCLSHGCQLGWVLDPGDYSIMTFLPNQAPQVCRDECPLTMLPDIELTLTPRQVFDWLKVKR